MECAYPAVSGEARDYFREILPGRVTFLKLECDPDIVIQSASCQQEEVSK